MSKTVKVTYNAETLMTEITVDGQSFDTSRINGKEIADWAYPFMMRKIKWNGFYDEMVEALGGEKSFDLIFDGSEDDLNELKEAWEDAPVNIISEECSGNNVVIEYDEDTLSTNITVNGVPFDTSRINGKEIDDWVYPFMMRKVKWGGIFEELANVTDSEEYTIEFSGSNSAMKVLMEECPESVEIEQIENLSEYSDKKSSDEDIDESLKQELEANESVIYNSCSSENDKEKAFKWLLSHSNINYSQIHFLIGKCFDEAIGTQQNYSEAVKWYTKAAENDDEDAQYQLGICYENGYGVEQNYEKAFEWYTKAAERDDDRALNSLADCYFHGIGVEQDYQKAAELYTKSAEQGNADAQDKLAFCYVQGYGIEENPQKAFQWYIKAANQGDYDAQHSLGLFYQYGFDVVEPDLKKAVEWYTKAAEQGYSDAQNSLGNCYCFGNGVEQDYIKAVEWYTKAVEQGNSNAQDNLGFCYQVGFGVQVDYKKTIELYTASAEQNNCKGIYHLAESYRTGTNGVFINKAKAKELFKKGMDLGDSECETAYNKMLQNGDILDKAKGIGLNFLKNSNGFWGQLGNAIYETLHEGNNQSDYDSDDKY